MAEQPEQVVQAAQRDGIDALLSAREKQRLDIAAIREMMLTKFNELLKVERWYTQY